MQINSNTKESLSKQRKDIIAKYHDGPIKSHADDWENPQYSIYAITDYYGFIHDGGFSDEFLLKEAKIKKLDCKREIKWRKLLEKKIVSKSSRASNVVVGSENQFAVISARMNDSVFREEMTKRVYKGIPQQYKSLIWQVFLEINSMKLNKPKVYQVMLKKALEKSPDVNQIDLDVNRTFRNTTYFRERFNDRQKALLHVLSAYSMYNTEIGYCQGMSEIGGLLLMYLVEEEDVFWGLSQLMTSSRWCMHGMFVAGFPRLLTFFSHLNVILQKLLPKIAKHFEKLELMSSAYALKWFMQCFLDRVPFTLFLRVWDIYLLEGEKLLIAMAYNIIKMHKKRIIKMDHCSILQFFQNELKKDFLYDDDLVVESLKGCIEELRKHKLSVPPPVQSYELPNRPFGTDIDFQTPSLATVKERQTAQANPEEVIRRSIKKQRKSEITSIPVYVKSPLRASSEEKKSLSRSASQEQSHNIKELKSDIEVSVQEKIRHSIKKPRKSEITSIPVYVKSPLQASSEEKKSLPRSASREQSQNIKELKSDIEVSVPTKIRYRVSQKGSQIDKPKSLYLEKDTKIIQNHDSHLKKSTLNSTSPDRNLIKSVPDLSNNITERPRSTETYTALRQIKSHSESVPPVEQTHFISPHNTNSIPKSQTIPVIPTLRNPTPLSLKRRPLSSSPETIL